MSTFAPHTFFVSHGSDSFVTHCFLLRSFYVFLLANHWHGMICDMSLPAKRTIKTITFHIPTHTFEATYLFAPSCIMQVSMYVLSISCLRVRARERECLMFVRHITRVYYKYARVVIRTS